jgi:hypothetical protein
MITKTFVLLVALTAATVCFTGCQSVDITKTAKGFHAPTNPNEVEILMTRPDKAYEELGTINATGFLPSETAKMHNALRAKAAPLGANAVVVTGSGMVNDGWGVKQYVMGVAIRWK